MMIKLKKLYKERHAILRGEKESKIHACVEYIKQQCLYNKKIKKFIIYLILGKEIPISGGRKILAINPTKQNKRRNYEYRTTRNQNYVIVEQKDMRKNYKYRKNFTR